MQSSYESLSTQNVNAIMNRVAVEVGLNPTSDPFGSTEEHFVQMRYLLNTAGEELAWLYPWEILKMTHTFVTDGVSDNQYVLPKDYLYMINQTNWTESQNRPMTGPLTPQQWVWTKNYMTGPVNVAFRKEQGLMSVEGAANGEEISYEYISRNWCVIAFTPPAGKATGYTTGSEAEQGSNVPLYDRTLFSRYLKVKWLDSKGFDSGKAQDDVNQMFSALTGRDKGAPVLDAGRGSRGIRLLNAYNVPDTGFGM